VRFHGRIAGAGAFGGSVGNPRAPNATSSTRPWRPALLDRKQWEDTAETLPMNMQIVREARLALTPIQNRWGISPFDRTRYRIRFQFSRIRLRNKPGKIRRIPLQPVFVAGFLILKSAVETEFGVEPKQDATAWLPARLSRISALPSRDCEGEITKINCSVRHRFGDNCFPYNRLTLELPRKRKRA
jgi:hypothetical protein